MRVLKFAMRRCMLFLAAGLASFAPAQPTFTHPDRVRYDGQCFTIDGKDTFLFSGAFHYFRCPKELWRERFRRIKEAGFNAVETYVPWNWSERNKPRGPNDFSQVDLKDLDDWMTMAEKEFGLYTILRPGPYICSEWATGGYPNWLTSFRPSALPETADWFRTDDPVYLDWCRHWYDAVAKVAAKHQLTRMPKGRHGLILWQVENEYDFAGLPDPVMRNQLRALIKDTREDGIEIPIFTCWTHPIRDPRGDPLLSQAFDAPNQYPGFNIQSAVDAIRDQHDAQPYAPKAVTELQGGWFGQVGGLAASEQNGISPEQTNALTLLAIQNGLTFSNYYMLFGGTNFGDWGGQGITTSYDYFAPIREWGGVGPKYRYVQAIGRMLQKYGPDLARSAAIDSPVASDQEKVQIGARRGPSGAVYLFVRNADRKAPAKGRLGGAVAYDLGPFGMNVYRYSGDPAQGAWIADPAPAPAPKALPAPMRLAQAEVGVPHPVDWRPAPRHATTRTLGVYDSRFLFFRAAAPQGATGSLWLRPSGDELIGLQPASPETRQGGQVWPSARDLTLVSLNPGWPNGGIGMEQERGVADVRLLTDLPTGVTLGGWKSKRIDDPSDRSLVGPDVDTTGWTDGDDPSLFVPHSTWVVRTSFQVDHPIAPETVLSIPAVDDEGWFYVNGQLVGEIHRWGTPSTFPIASALRQGRNDVALVIRNNDGAGGLTDPVTIEPPLPESRAFDWQWTDRTRIDSYQSYGLDTAATLAENEHPKPEGPRQVHGSLLVSSRVSFPRPTGDNVAWEIVLEAGGDGFLTLNGHPLGRYWEVGPQRAFFLPGPWLKDRNVLELTVVPGRFGDRIKSAEIRALPMER